MHSSMLFTRFEMITPEISADEAFKLTADPDFDKHEKFVILTCKLNDHHFQSRLSKHDSESIPFFKAFPATVSPVQHFSDFSIERFITKTDSQVIESKLANCQKTLSQIKSLVSEYPDILDKYFDSMEEQIFALYKNLVEQLMESRLKLHSELDSFQQKCLNNIKMQSAILDSMREFVDDHQIDPKTIEFYLSSSDSALTVADDWLAEVENIRELLSVKRGEFASFILMNKKVNFRPTFIDSRCIQQGILNCYDFSESEQVPVQFYRLEEFILNREIAPVLNSFEMESRLIRMRSAVASIHSLDDVQRILVVVELADEVSDG